MPSQRNDRGNLREWLSGREGTIVQGKSKQEMDLESTIWEDEEKRGDGGVYHSEGMEKIEQLSWEGGGKLS